MHERTHLDLFSGIGGFALAAQWAGCRTVAFCERDKFCQAVLKKHWPEVPCHEDICKLDGTQYRGVDLLTGGFPCQPFSCAGKRRGKEDDRYLWPEMLRVITEAGPDWVLGENVTGIINLELDGCISDLESAGYAVQAFVIPVCAVDARHRRDRVWILAHAKRYGCRPWSTSEPRREGGPTLVDHAGEVLADTNAIPGRTESELEHSQRPNVIGRGGQALADTEHGHVKPGSELRPGRHAAEFGGQDVPDADKPGLQRRGGR